MPSINDFLSGFSNGLPGMKDYQHASRLYIDENYKLIPKQKFLFHVVFTLSDTALANPLFQNYEKLSLNMLVKSCQLPKYNMNVEQKQSYNRKVPVATHITYQPINITFHDDHADVVNGFWKSYYEYHISDSLAGYNTNGKLTKDTFYNSKGSLNRTQFGMDNYQLNGEPVIRQIEIFALHKQRFTSFKLINPVIGGFSHDDLEQTEGNGIMANTMEVFYETVLYGAGLVKTSLGTPNRERIPGFATLHYDLEPSPLSVLGRGTTSIFGPGGIIDGIGSVIGDVRNGNVGLGTILKGINTYNNAKKIKAKDAVKEELKGIVKEGVIKIGKNAGTITNPVGNFSLGNAAVAAVAVGSALASAKNTVDQKNVNNRVVSNYVIDTQTFLSPTEAFNLVTVDATIRDEIAAGIYYKKVGSRKNQTVAESDIAYAALTDAQKDVYRNSVLTDITKLVTEGFIKISRNTYDVTVNAEKANV